LCRKEPRGRHRHKLQSPLLRKASRPIRLSQAMQQIRGSVQDLMDRRGLTEDFLIEKYLVPLLEWEETVFFQQNGKVKDSRTVPCGSIRHSALRTAFELQGSYAPKLHDNKASGGNVTVILDVPRPDYSKLKAPINVTPANGNEQAKKIENGYGPKPDPRPRD
jgi:hypothetical protein